MSIHTFFKSLVSSPARSRLDGQSRLAFRPQLETLEDRCLLAGPCYIPPVYCSVHDADLPIATFPDAYTVQRNHALHVPATGVMANDYVPFHGYYHAASLFAGPVNGSLSLHSDGSFTYVPNPGFLGLDAFAYVVHSQIRTSVSIAPYPSGTVEVFGEGFSAPTPVTILVTPEMDSHPAPVVAINVSPTSGLVTGESDRSGGRAAFAVWLNSMPAADVIIPFHSDDTTEGTVTAASLVFTPLNWNHGAQVVYVRGVDDSIVDGDVAYTIVTGPASSLDPRYNGLNPADVSVTNQDDEPPPAIAISDVRQNKGNSGTASFIFTVSLSAASYQTVTVNYATADGTAKAGSDYQATSGTLTFAPGETSKTIIVLVNGDTVKEADEAFYVNLSGATNATIADAQAIATILNDD